MSDSTGVRLRRVVEEAGGVDVKVGQIAATRTDLVPPAICEELVALQNRVPAEPVERIKPALEAELGAEAGRRCSPSRLEAAGRRLHRPDLPGPPA